MGEGRSSEDGTKLLFPFHRSQLVDQNMCAAFGFVVSILFFSWQ